ncbi:hypothetical protein DIJ64_09600 [Mycobacterium leprae]|uniref:Uncharacterized protein n=1 Tax=Mycobacterium leprae TaxID=1769 RepID=A0AAD0P8E7_MYCLR|nr:hypothetical protein DIJ64_09600 [Mycobacterium leprae]OAR20853.1 hypothetical protein A8144_09255 [Mycobacterium leprae 3125609]OAX70955.1 hypothetical protein A3216_08670 [Mycobacterium leprae 7935681]
MPTAIDASLTIAAPGHVTDIRFINNDIENGLVATDFALARFVVDYRKILIDTTAEEDATGSVAACLAIARMDFGWHGQ